MNDFKFAFRQLLKNPGFATVAVLTLALGIGANTAIFSFVNAILLRPLPYKDPERLVMVFENHLGNGWPKAQVGAPMLGEWRRQSTVFEGLGARGWDDFIFTGKGQPETLKGSRLSANMFSLLGCKPMLGRDFLSEEETYGKHFVALLSYELWRRRFGGDPSVIGQSITLNSELHTIIGVMPPRTFFPDRDIQVWAPLAFSANRLSQRHAHRYLVYGKLKPAATLAQARSEMDVIARRMAEAGREDQGWGAEVHPLREIIVAGSRRTLFVMLGAVGMVLLIGCANIANLLLTRSAARGREFAIRAALGAERPRIIRQLLTEGVLLATVGGVLGLLVAAAGLKFLVQLSPPDLPRVWEGIHFDGLALGFTALISLATGLVFGLVPALQAASPRLAQRLCESGRGNSAGRQRQRVGAALVVSQVALSVMLLIGAGLLIRSFERLVEQSPGFVPENLITAGITLPDQKYPEESDRTRFLGQLLDRVRSLPGVNSAALVQGVPLSGNNNGIAVWILDAPAPAPGQSVSSGYAQVSADYFRTMNIPVLHGRDFSEHDRTNTAAVAIVDEMFVKNFKLGTNVVGRRIRLGDRLDSAEIIGVVRDIKRTGLAEAPRGEVYRTYQQICWNGMSLVIRTRRDPADVTRALRSEVDALDKDQPLENVRTMTQLVSASVAPRRLSVQLLTAFAGVAMLLAAIGLYGVLAYQVTQRRQEIGIRMALGAKRHDVLSLVLGQAIKLAMIGVGIGVVAALTLTRVMQKLLYEIEPTDPLTFAVVCVLLLGVALFAGWLPARRAAKVDPMEALRCE